MERTLRDGTIVSLRPIAPTDKSALTAALEALSPDTVHRRFLGPKVRFSTKELRYLTEVDGRDHVAIVAEEPEHPGRIVAVARWVRLIGQPDAAEFAIVVGDHLQGKGLGSLLADELAATAKLNGVTRFTASTLSENEPILRIMARLSTHLERHHTGMGTSEVAFDLAA
jgi:RimJ/RimL family protein N-acetyltransferase